MYARHQHQIGITIDRSIIEACGCRRIEGWRTVFRRAQAQGKSRTPIALLVGPQHCVDDPNGLGLQLRGRKRTGLS